MLETLQLAYNGLKTSADLVQGFFALKSETEKNQAVIDIQRHVLDAQRALLEADTLHASDLKRISALEEQIARMENWQTDAECYKLTAIDRGAFAYMHKPGMDQGEPPMWLCQTCFEKRHKSPLQFRGQDRGDGAQHGGRGSHSRWGCNSCKAEIVVHYQRNPNTPWELNPASEAPKPSGGIVSRKIVR